LGGDFVIIGKIIQCPGVDRRRNGVKGV
jgi:hypothetical protein